MQCTQQQGQNSGGMLSFRPRSASPCSFNSESETVSWVGQVCWPAMTERRDMTVKGGKRLK